MHNALEPLRTPRQAQRLDLATALGLGIDQVGPAGSSISLALCADLAERQDYWAFLAAQGLPGRSVLEAHPRALSLLARRGGTPIGAAALLPVGAAGPPMPEPFRQVIDRLQRAGRILAALDPVVIAPEQDPQDAGLALRAMLRLAFLAARRLDGLSDLLVRSEPRYARFFSQVLLFAVEAEAAPEGDVPAQVLLRLDLDLCPGEYLRLYGEGTWSPYALYVRPNPQSARVLAWLRARRQPPSPADLLHGWIRPVDGSPPADSEALAALRHIHPHPFLDTASAPRQPGTGPIPRIRTPLPFDV